MDDWIEEGDEPDDDGDRCPNCGQDAIEKTPIAMGGGMTELWKVCQMCGYVAEED